MNECCQKMQDEIDQICSQHGKDCVDILIMKFSDGSYGLPIHDGGTSGVVINFCPWCGYRLPIGDKTVGFRYCNYAKK